MPKTLRTLLLVLLVSAAGRMMYGDTLTFNDRLSRDGASYTVNQYGAFTFYNFDAINPMTFPNPFPNNNTVYIEGSYYPFEPPPYPYYYVLDNYGVQYQPADVPNFYPTSGQPFTLNSMQIVTISPTPVWVLGYRNGVLVDEALTSEANSATALLTLNWTGIDGVLFPDGFQEADIEIDNITVNEPVSPSTVPEPGSIVLFGSGMVWLWVAGRRRLVG